MEFLTESQKPTLVLHTLNANIQIYLKNIALLLEWRGWIAVWSGVSLAFYEQL